MGATLGAETRQLVLNETQQPHHATSRFFCARFSSLVADKAAFGMVVGFVAAGLRTVDCLGVLDTPAGSARLLATAVFRIFAVHGGGTAGVAAGALGGR